MKKDYKSYIIHGWAYSTEKYKKVSNLLKEKGVENVLLKVPGLTEKLHEVWDLNNYVAWLNKIINKEKHKSILIGHSNGGRIAAAYASKYPNKLSHLILIDSAGIYHDEFHVRIRMLFFELLARIGKKISDSATLRNLLYKIARENDYNSATPLMKKTMTNLIKSDLLLKLDKITTPTLIIWGENDKVTRLNDGKMMHMLIPNSKLHIVKGARHSPHFTNAEETAEVIYKNLTTKK